LISITATTPADPLKCPNVPEGNVYLVPSGGTPDYTFLWSNGQTTQDLVGVVVGSYSVTITDAVGCTMSKTITVDGPEMFRITDSLITPAKCSYLMEGDDIGSIQINSTTGGTPNFTYLWDFPASNPTEGALINKLSSGDYTVTITDGNECTYTHSFFVPSDPNFYMKAYAGKDTSLCLSDSISIFANPQGPSNVDYTYSWYIIPDISGVPVSIDSTYKISPSTNTSYYLEIRNEVGCFSNDTVDIGVYPRVDLSVPLYITAVQDSIISILSGTSYNMDVIAGSLTYPTTFNWEPAILFSPADSWNSSIYSDDAIFAQIPESRKVELFDPQTRRYSNFILVDAKAVTSVGCADSLRLYARFVDKVSFGNVFSPNGDGINDLWQVPKNYLFPDLEIEIFNRWGALVWSASGDNAIKGWNGRTNKGNELPIGTYYYVIKYNINTSDGKWTPVTGSITIVR